MRYTISVEKSNGEVYTFRGVLSYDLLPNGIKFIDVKTSREMVFLGSKVDIEQEVVNNA